MSDTPAPTFAPEVVQMREQACRNLGVEISAGEGH